MGERTLSPIAAVNGGVFQRLSDGSVVIASPLWGSSGVNADGVGAVTRFDPHGPTSGVVDAGNSIVGNKVGDRVGSCGAGCTSIAAVQNGGFTVYSWKVDGAGGIDVGAVTLGAPGGGIVGPVMSGNSVIGKVPGTPPAGGVLVPYNWLTQTQHLLVGAPLENRVYIIGP